MVHSVSMSVPRENGAADLPLYTIRCFNSTDDVSEDWPAATRNAPGKIDSKASPNYHIYCLGVDLAGLCK